jgi:hypothetical protein
MLFDTLSEITAVELVGKSDEPAMSETTPAFVAVNIREIAKPTRYWIISEYLIKYPYEHRV